MSSGSWVGVLSVGLALVAACGDDDEAARTGAARGTRGGMTADEASKPAADGPRVRVEDGSARDAAIDASALDGGLDAALDGSLDGSVSDAMPSPMPVEDAAADARPPGTGGSSGLGGHGGGGGAAAVGGF
jgi:hypothetical protein